MQSAFQHLVLLYVLDAPTARADGPFHDLAFTAGARLRARDELDARSALLAVLRLFLVMHGLLGRLPLRERRPRTGRCGQAGEDGGALKHDPAGSSHFDPPVRCATIPAAARSINQCTLPTGRSRPAGMVRLPAWTRASASFFAAPVTRNAVSRLLSSAGAVSVMRASFLAPCTGSTQRRSSSSAAWPGKSDAV